MTTAYDRSSNFNCIEEVNLKVLEAMTNELLEKSENYAFDRTYSMMVAYGTKYYSEEIIKYYSCEFIDHWNRLTKRKNIPGACWEYLSPEGRAKAIFLFSGDMFTKLLGKDSDDFESNMIECMNKNADEVMEQFRL